MTNSQPKTFLSALLSPLTGADRLEIERNRLEAFLNAFPGEYCGFHPDGSVAYSDGFCAMLGLSGIKTVEDIQAVLDTGDSAALEGQYFALEQTGKAFSLNVRLAGRPKILRLRGAIGQAADREDRFFIIWAEDITEEAGLLQQIKAARQAAEKELGLMSGGLDNLPVPVWIRDGNAELIWVNHSYATMLGMEKDDVIASQSEIVVSPKSKGKPPKELAREALNEGRIQSAQSHIIVGGKRKWMSLTEKPLPGTGNTLGYAHDLTREEDLQSELTRYLSANKSLLEQLRSAIALFGSDQGLEFFNSAFSQLWGLEEQWLNTRPKLGDILEKLREIRRLPEQADFRKYKQGWLEMFTRLIDPHEDMLYLPDGKALRMLIVPHPMGGLMMTFEDVSSRLELESSYNTLIAVQKETLDNLAEGVAVFGGDGRMRLSNPSFASIWQLNPEELENSPHITKLVDRMAGFFTSEEWPPMRKALIAHGLEREIQEGRFERKDGVFLRYATMPLPDGGMMASYYDITDSTRVENALREKNAALETAEQLKTDFLANVSYQLRTPLNAIMGFSEILDHQYFGTLNDRQKEYTSGIREAGDRLISLIDDILDLATIEAGYLELHKQTVDITKLLNDLSDLTTEWARKERLEIKIDSFNAVPEISIDERRIKQALLNIIRNSIAYTPPGGKIGISCDKKGDNIIIAVSDTGTGINPDDIERIFSPFERSGQASQSQGAGLGLSLVKNIVELHDGRVTIESELGKGTIVTLSLPLHTAG